MQAATHLAAGAALAGALPGRPWLAAGLAALSHPLLDDLAIATYHRPDPAWGDPLWVGYHAAVLAATLATAWVFRRSAGCMAAAMLPDLDWVARPLGLWPPETLHAAFRALPGIAPLSAALHASLPDLRYVHAAALLEVALCAALVAAALRLRRRESAGGPLA